MLRLEPAMVSAAKGVERSPFDHDKGPPLDRQRTRR